MAGREKELRARHSAPFEIAWRKDRHRRRTRRLETIGKLVEEITRDSQPA